MVAEEEAIMNTEGIVGFACMEIIGISFCGRSEISFIEVMEGLDR